MTLAVYTARIGLRDPDVFDITRKTGGVEGDPFAPSWRILRPAIDAFREAKRNAGLIAAAAERATGGRLDAATKSAGVRQLSEPIWEKYVPAYRGEMLYSYERHRPAWDALLARERVVLICYCVDPGYCHRTLLAGYLGKLGAEVHGELVHPAPAKHAAGAAR